MLLAARNRVAMGARGLHLHPRHARHVVGRTRRELKIGLGHVVFALFYLGELIYEEHPVLDCVMQHCRE
jgi:hypothetical protein